MLILHPFVYGVRPDDQAHCWEALEEAEGAGFKIEHLELSAADPFQYSREIRQRWRKDDLLIVEHDVAPSVELLVAMANCEHPLCTRLYDGQAPVVGVTHLGCTKIALSVQEALPCPALPSTQYTNLDVTITEFCSYWTRDYWHCHTEPLVHYHERPPWQKDDAWHAVGHQEAAR